jgi:hypothetical protein
MMPIARENPFATTEKWLPTGLRILSPGAETHLPNPSAAQNADSDRRILRHP